MRDAASATALLVARGVAFRATDPTYQHLVPERSRDLTLRLLRRAGARIRTGSSRFDRFVVRLMEYLTVPGLSLHYILRKRCIEELLRQSIADGYVQLVVIGAGLDTIAIRLAEEMPHLNAIEIDHPATQKLKRDLLRGERETAPVTFVAADLTRDKLDDVLARCKAFDRDAPTIFLAEAVFLYLTAEEVRSTLRALRQPGRRTRLLFTFFGARRKRGINFQNATVIADLWLRWRGEPPRWAIDPSVLAVWLAEERFKLQHLSLDHESRRGDVAPSVPLARGEHVAMADA